MATRDAKAGAGPGWAATRPLETVPAALPPLPRKPAPRPAEPWQATQPANPWQATRPADPWQVTRPAELGPTARLADRLPAGRAPGHRPGQPARTPPSAPARPRPALSAPQADGPWQLEGQPGAHLVLMPGQMHLGHQVASLRTLLGSCVAITLWHPARRIGGMCHYLLPQRQRRPDEPPDGRYGDEAVAAMVQRLQALGTQPGDYVAHLYGGADTLAGSGGARFNIGERNIEQGWSLIDRYGFQLDGVDVGEDIPRVVSLALASGTVSMRRGQGHAPDHLRG